MKILKPHYYDKFTCIGGECPDTCCAGWNIEVDKKSSEIYKNVPGEFGDKLRSSIKEDEKTSFILDKNFSCPFLNKNGLCDIYINIGADKLCDTCKVYPRIIQRYDDIYESNLTLSCPEVARILVACNDPIDFYFGEEDISDEMVNEAKNDYLFNALIKARGLSVDLMQMKEIPLWKRIFLCISIADKLQKSIGQNEFNLLSKSLEQFENVNYINNYLKAIDTLPQNELLKQEQYKELLRTILKMNLTNKKFNEYLGETINYFNSNDKQYNICEILRIYENENNQKEYIFDNYFVYHLFRYYMMTYKDKDLYEHIVLMIEGYALIKLFAAIRWYNNRSKITLKEYEEILYSYSRTMEHSFSRFKEIYTGMEEKGYHTLACLSVLIR